MAVLAVLVVGAYAAGTFFITPPPVKEARTQVTAPAAGKTEKEEQNEAGGEAPQVAGTGALKRKEGVYNFLLLGSDKGGGNADTIIVASYDTKSQKVGVLSVPRDTMVDRDWSRNGKINAALGHGGPELLAEEITKTLGVPIDYYFHINLQGFVALVDELGGVDVDIPVDMNYDDPYQNLHIHFEPGLQHIDGDDAVRILRWRKNNSGESLSVGDVGRVEIQHSFLRALAKEMVSLGTLTKIGDIVDIMNRNLDSNLNYGEMIWFGEKALGLGEDSIRFHNLPGDYTGTIWSPTYKNYQSYVFVNSTALRELVNQYMNPYQTAITADMQHVVHDTTVNNLPVEDNSSAAAGTGQSATETN